MHVSAETTSGRSVGVPDGRRVRMVAVAALVAIATTVAGIAGAGPAAADPCDWEQPTNYIANRTVTAAERYNLRGQPHTDCTPVGVIEKGATVRIVARHGDWRYVQIQSNGKWGWVHRDAFTPGTTPAPPRPSPPTTPAPVDCSWQQPTQFLRRTVAQTATARYNRRAQPYTGCDPIGSIEPGSSFHINALRGEWRYGQDQSNGKWGWVHADAFKPRKS